MTTRVYFGCPAGKTIIKKIVDFAADTDHGVLFSFFLMEGEDGSLRRLVLAAVDGTLDELDDPQPSKGKPCK